MFVIKGICCRLGTCKGSLAALTDAKVSELHYQLLPAISLYQQLLLSYFLWDSLKNCTQIWFILLSPHNRSMLSLSHFWDQQLNYFLISIFVLNFHGMARFPLSIAMSLIFHNYFRRFVFDDFPTIIDAKIDL